MEYRIIKEYNHGEYQAQYREKGKREWNTVFHKEKRWHKFKFICMYAIKRHKKYGGQPNITIFETEVTQ